MVNEKDIDLAQARRRIAQTLAAKRFGTPQEFAAFLEIERSKWSAVIKKNNIVVE